MQTRSPNNIKLIDVSRHQGSIDWQLVGKSGVKGAYVKATEGVGYIDPMFRRNAVGAAAVGLKVGYYHYARPETGNSAKAEAEAYLDTIRGMNPSLPHVLDVEGAAANIGKDRLSDWVADWLTAVTGYAGQKVMIYTGASFAKSYLLGAKLAGYPLWVAHYDAERPMSGPTWDRWAMWQYTSGGSVPGIAGRVDMNEMDLAFWRELFEVSSQTFKDVPASHWASSAIEAANAAGVLAGYTDGTFKPSQPVTRAELAVFWAKMQSTSKKE